MATAKYDHYGRREPEIIYLATPDRRILCALNSVDEESVSLTRNARNTHTLSFDVYRYIDDNPSNCYDYIEEGMQLYTDGIWFQINNPPETHNDGITEYKSLNCESYEITLQQYDLVNFMVNTASAGSYDWEYNKKHNSSTGDEDGIDFSNYKQIKFHNSDNPDLSLTDIMLKHANVPRWKIGYVDDTLIIPDSYNESELLKSSDGYTLTDSDGVYLSTGTTNQESLPLPLCEEIYYFEEQSIDLYSFITQKLSQAFRCIAGFDTDNYLINFYRIENIGKNTNICVGFRNVENSVSITRDNPLYTHYTVSGGNGLDGIAPVNFGSDEIWDISYFTRYPFMPDSLVAKYNAWLEYRESRRDEYIDLSRQYNNYLNTVTDIQYRVPSDTVTTDYSTMTVDDLQTAYNDNILLILGIEDGYIDETGNFDLSALQASSDWKLYSSIMNYTLPSIVAALQLKETNPELDSSIQEIIDSDDYATGRFVTADYGKGNLLANVNPVIINESWLGYPMGIISETFELTDSPCYGLTRGIRITNTDGDPNVGFGYAQKQIHVNEGSMYCLSVYTRALSNVSKINLEYGSANTERTIISFDLTGDSWQRVSYVFRADSPMIDIAFSGISSSTGESVYEICGMQLEIGEAPTQFGFFIQRETIIESYETDWDSFGTEELKIKLETYEQQVAILKDSGYADAWGEYSDVEEEYHSQMHQMYLDYLKLCEECSAALEMREIELDEAKAHLEEINQARLQIVDDVAMESFGAIQTEFSDFTESELALIRSFFVHRDYTNENIITTSIDDENAIIDKQIQLCEDANDILYAEAHPQWSYSGDFENLLALAEYDNFIGEMDLWNYLRIEAHEGEFVKLRLTSMTYNPCIWDSELSVEFSSMIQYRNKRDDWTDILENMQSSSKNTGGNISSAASSESFTITPDIIRSLLKNPAMQNAISTGSVNATSGRIDYLVTKNLTSEKIVTGILEADKAYIDQLSAIFVTSDKVLTAMLTADEAKIREVLASKISVGDLLAHNATAEMITLISSDGQPTIAFQNSTQQFYDGDGNVRVQIGQDGNGDFNFIVIGEDGTTALFDSTGIKKDGIPDNTIVNNMLEDATISKEKLGFEIIEPNEYGGVDITQVYDGNGGQFGVEYTTFKESVSSSLETLDNKIDSTATYTLYIETPNGCHMIPSGLKMNARLFKNSVDVTDDWDDSYFTWTRQSSDSYGDLYWNERHATGTKSLTITGDDVYKDASFQCKFETEEITVLSS